MKTQNQPKPPSKKRVRVRVQYTARIEAVDENDNPVGQQRAISHPIDPVDKAGFEKAYELVEIARIAKQDEIDQEYKQELERHEAAKRLAARTVPERIFAFLIGR